MKNTVKKILALVFVVAMVCSLAVPAFAAEEFEAYNVKVVVVDAKGVPTSKTVSVASAKKANVLDVLKAFEADTSLKIDFTFKNNVLTAVKDTNTTPTKVFDTKKNAFETEGLVVALNGKAIATDLSTVAVAEDDVIVVYWADATIGTKLVVVDDSNIAAGIVAFYYYDAEGNKQPLTDLAVELSPDADFTDNDQLLNYLNVTGYNPEGVANAWDTEFVTDEKGEIWLAPEYLHDKAGATYYVDLVDLTATEIEELKLNEKNSDYSEKQIAYYNEYIAFALVDDALANVVVEKNLYNVAGATGDMTVVYALVAFAAVATLAAVVVMKKKSVKAN